MSIVTYRYSIAAPDRGAAERRHLATDALLDELVRDPQTQRLFARLRNSTGLGRTMATLRRKISAQVPEVSVRRADTAFVQHVAEVRKRLGAPLSDYVAQLFGRYIPWLALELLAAFLRDLAGQAYNQQTVSQRSLAATHRPRQVVWSIPEDLSDRDVKAMMRRIAQALRDAKPATGRQPRKKAGSVTRNAVWYYRHMVQRVPIHQLAREYHETAHGSSHYHAQDVSDHPLILRGIRETARLLNLPLRLSSSPR